jgi:hypothetical protein
MALPTFYVGVTFQGAADIIKMTVGETRGSVLPAFLVEDLLRKDEIRIPGGADVGITVADVNDPVVGFPETAKKRTLAVAAPAAIPADRRDRKVYPVSLLKHEAVGEEFDIETVFAKDRLDIDVEAVGHDLKIDPTPSAEAQEFRKERIQSFAAKDKFPNLRPVRPEKGREQSVGRPGTDLPCRIGAVDLLPSVSETLEEGVAHVHPADRPVKITDNE